MLHIFVLLVTATLAALGLSSSFYVVRDSGIFHNAAATVVYWPMLLVMLAFSDSGMPDLALNGLAFAAEYLYVWAIAAVSLKAHRALRSPGA